MVAQKMRKLSPRDRSLLPQAVTDAILELEKNTNDFADQVIRWAQPRFEPVEPQSNYIAKPWDMVICRKAISIVLPAPTSGNKGAEILIVKITAPIISVSAMSGVVDGATSTTGPAANRARTYVSSGEGWHSVA